MPSSYALALHTTSDELGLAVGNLSGEMRSQVWRVERNMSTHLHEYLAAFLRPQGWADLAFLAVAQGPGSFTSTRIGIVTARTLAQQLEIPLFAISTLAAIAHQSLPPSPLLPLDLAVQMPAQRDQIFAALYTAEWQPGNPSRRIRLTCQIPDQAIAPDRWQQQLADWPRPYQSAIATHLGASVTSVLALAETQWEQGDRPTWKDALPFYGQTPV